MKIYLYFLFLSVSFSGLAQGPKVLILTAHPDDATMFPVTVFQRNNSYSP